MDSFPKTSVSKELKGKLEGRNLQKMRGKSGRGAVLKNYSGTTHPVLAESQVSN